MQLRGVVADRDAGVHWMEQALAAWLEVDELAHTCSALGLRRHFSRGIPIQGMSIAADAGVAVWLLWSWAGRVG